MNLAEVYDLAAEIAAFWDDPLGFVQHCYPWDEGELAGFTGPDANQATGHRLQQLNVERIKGTFHRVYCRSS